MSKALFFTRGLLMKNALRMLILLSICSLFTGCTMEESVVEENETSQKELSIYSTYESATLNEAISCYTETYPDVEIELVTCEERTVEEITNAILSGQDAPDLIVLDDFKNRGIELQDELLPIKEEINGENLIISLKEDAVIYSIPLRVSVPLVFATQLKFSTVEAIIEDSNNFILTDVNYEDLIDIFYLYYPVNFIDESQKINAEQLQIFLENIKNTGENIGASIEENPSELKEDEWYQIKNFLINNNSIMYHDAQGIEDVKYYVGATGKVHGNATFVDGLCPQLQVAVYKNSPVIDKCIDFINIALSDKIQKNDWSDGFPVTISALEAWGESYQKTEENIILEKQGDEELTVWEPEKSEVQILLSMIKDSPEIYTRDVELMEIIKDNTSDYWEENESVENVVKNIIDIYEMSK